MPGSKNLPLNFYILIGARLISTFGTFLSIIAVNVLILQLTGSATWVAAAIGVKVFAGMIASPLVGYFADRYNRKTLMVLSDLILTVALLLLVGLGDHYAKYYIIILMFLTGVFSNLFEVCLSSAMPVILEGKQILKANSIMMGGRNVMIGLSGLLAVVANYLFKDYYSIFIVDAATYLISAIALLALKIKTAESSTKRTNDGQRTNFFSELKEDYKAVARLENFNVILLMVGVLFIDALASASHNVGFPVFSKILNADRPMYYYGLIVSIWAAGNIAGIYFLAKIPFLNSAKPEKLYLFFTALMSIGMLMIFQTKIPSVIFLFAFIAGIGDGIYQTYYATYVQNVEDSVRGKLFAITGFALRTGFGIGFILVPILLNYFSIARTVFFCHFPVALICITYFMILQFKPSQELATEEN